jgi:hypothetical protein
MPSGKRFKEIVEMKNSIVLSARRCEKERKKRKVPHFRRNEEQETYWRTTSTGVVPSLKML